MRFILISICILSCLFIKPIIAENKVRLTAGHVYAEEDTKILIASSNVKLEYGDVKIFAPRIHLDTYSNYIWGTGNIRVHRGEDVFNSSYIFFDMNKNIVKLENIDIAVQPPDSKELLFVKANQIEDTGEVKKGKSGIFTSCELETPHYSIWSQNFEYYPDQRIIGYNNFVYTPILFIPMYLWTPVYVYELGERKIVWNFPSIGKK